MVALLLALLALPAGPIVGGRVYRATVEAGGAQVAVWRYAAAHGPKRPPVLLLPELGFDKRIFANHGRGLALTLQDRGHEVFVLEWRGTGSSSRPLPGMGGLDALFDGDARAALRLAAASTPEHRVQIVGVGLGGAAAYLLAAEPDSSVSAVVAVGVPSFYEVPNEAVQKLIAVARLGPKASGPLDLKAWSRLPAAVGAGERDLFELLLAYGSAAPGLREALGLAAPELAQDVARWMELGDLPRGPKLKDALAALRCPLLIVAGPRDNLVHLEHALAVRTLAPLAPRDELLLQRVEGWPEDAGHLMLQAKWAHALWSRIADWLEK